MNSNRNKPTVKEMLKEVLALRQQVAQLTTYMLGTIQEDGSIQPTFDENGNPTSGIFQTQKNHLNDIDTLVFSLFTLLFGVQDNLPLLEDVLDKVKTEENATKIRDVMVKLWEDKNIRNIANSQELVDELTEEKIKDMSDSEIYQEAKKLFENKYKIKQEKEV